MTKNYIGRREVMVLGMGALLASACDARGQTGTVDVRDFIKGDGPGAADRGFAAALAAATTVTVPAGDYHFELAEPVSIPAGRTLIGNGRPVLRKTGSALDPIFLVENQANVALRGLALTRSVRLDSQLPLAAGQQQVTVPWPLGTPPAIAVAIGDGKSWRPLQPGSEFSLSGNTVRLSPSVSRAGADRIRLSREPALAPLVQLSNATASQLSDLQCTDGALWIGGTDNRALNVTVEDCHLSNGQILVHGGIDNWVTPLHADLHSAPRNGPRSVRIAGNQLRGRIAEGTQPYYLRFGERAAGIEVQSSASDLVITGNSIERQAGDGIWLASCVDSHILNNEVHDNALSGIGLENGSTSPSHGCVIQGNHVSGSWFDGCDFNFGDKITDADIQILDNEFARNGYDIKPINGGCGIFVTGVANATIAKNTCQDNRLAGICCQNSRSVVLDQNVCQGNGSAVTRQDYASRAQIAIGPAQGLTVRGNRCQASAGSGRACIGFKEGADVAGAQLSDNRTEDGAVAEIGVWDRKQYTRAP